MGRKQLFLHLTRALARVPSLFWAFSFLLVIPLFATVYWLLPYQFYHPTAKFEQIVNRKEQDLLFMLHGVIGDSFREAHGADTITDGHWTFGPDTLSLRSIRADEDSIIIEASAGFRESGGGDGVELTVPFSFSFGTDIRVSILRPGASVRSVIMRIRVDDPGDLPIPVRTLFPFELDPSLQPASWSAEEPKLPIRQPLLDDLVEFSNAVRGFPSKIAGSYARMLYFSAITITTLGYGDIVPLTDLTRLLVALESVLGLLLIGLFLNSLFREESR